MCTVLLRFAPGTPWPLLLGAVRDEFVDRAWDPPARHWDGPAADLIGGRDLVAGGTWLAVRPDPPAVAALVNGVRREPPDRLSRGALPLAALSGQPLGDPARYDGYHLLVATTDRVDLWSWDGTAPVHRRLDPGDHVLVNRGLNIAEEPLVSRLTPALAQAATPDPRPGLATADAWGDWVDLMGTGGLDPTDPRALVVRRRVFDRDYGSTSACLVGLGERTVRYDFTAEPARPRWYEVPVRSGARTLS